MTVEELVKKIRSFNRYYTNIMGLLDSNLYSTGYSLSETRILYEICDTENCNLKKLSEKMNLDKGYLSRTISKLEYESLITRKQSDYDQRLLLICLTPKGEELVARSSKESDRQIAEKVRQLGANEREELSSALETVQKHFEKEPIYIMW